MGRIKTRETSDLGGARSRPRDLSLRSVLEVIRFRPVRHLLVALLTASLFFVAIGAATEVEPKPATSRAMIFPISLDVDRVAAVRAAGELFEEDVLPQLDEERQSLGGEPLDVSVLPVAESAALEIRAEHTDPDTAADLANSAARMMVKSLNGESPSIGSFAVQMEAVPDPSSLDGGSTLRLALAIAIGMVAALASAVASIILDGRASSHQIHRTAPAPLRDSLDGPTRLVEVRDDRGEETRSRAPRVVPSDAESSELMKRLREAARVQTELRRAARKHDRNSPSSGIAYLPRRAEDAGGLRASSGSGDSQPDARNVIVNISGIGAAFGTRLASIGITTVERLAQCDPAWLAERIDVKLSSAEDWVDQALSMTEYPSPYSEEA